MQKSIQDPDGSGEGKKRLTYNYLNCLLGPAKWQLTIKEQNELLWLS